MADWPITFDDVRAASERLRPHLSPTPVRGYGLLDEAVGRGVRVRVKHENFQPTGAFKVRNGVSALGALAPEVRRRGVVAATRGNHGLGLAWAGTRRAAADMAQTALTITRVRDIADSPFGLGPRVRHAAPTTPGARARNALSA